VTKQRVTGACSGPRPAAWLRRMLGNGMCTDRRAREEAALNADRCPRAHRHLSGAMPRSWNVTPGMRGNLGVPTTAGCAAEPVPTVAGLGALHLKAKEAPDRGGQRSKAAHVDQVSEELEIATL